MAGLVADCMVGVGEEIQGDLANLGTIREDRADVRIQVRLDFHIAGNRSTHYLQVFGYQFRQVAGLQFLAVHAAEGENLANQVRCLLPVLDDSIRVSFRFLIIPDIDLQQFGTVDYR